MIVNVNTKDEWKIKSVCKWDLCTAVIVFLRSSFCICCHFRIHEQTEARSTAQFHIIIVVHIIIRRHSEPVLIPKHFLSMTTNSIVFLNAGSNLEIPKSECSSTIESLYFCIT